MGTFTATYGVLAALIAREKTGRGQRVDASILGGISHLIAYPLTFHTLWDMQMTVIPRKNQWNPLYNRTSAPMAAG